MFRKKTSDITDNTVSTVIGKSIVVEGVFTSNENVYFAGTMNGDMKVHGMLEITEGAHVHGNIEAVNLIIAGTVEGNCKTTEKLEIKDGGTLKGDVSVGDQFIVSPGATFLGNSMMTEKAEIEFEERIIDDLDDLDIDLDEI